jgi:hypothetical protein
MIDYESLEWYLTVEVRMMEVGDLAEMIGNLEDIGHTDKVPFGNYDYGYKETDGIQLYYNRKEIVLYLNEISNADMPQVMRILTSYRGLRIAEIFHECLSRSFRKKFDRGLYEPQMLDEYANALTQTGYDYKGVWKAWCEESGFNAWCMEVYEDDE